MTLHTKNFGRLLSKLNLSRFNDCFWSEPPIVDNQLSENHIGGIT